jgi:adenosylcobinamide-GDP ribazoletransferase
VLLALTFLTRLPLPTRTATLEEMARSTRFYPLAGGVVAATGVLALLAVTAFWGPIPGAVAACAAMLAMSGGLHLDGLADCFDGLFTNGDASRRLAAMRDPHVGGLGAASTGLWVLGRTALIGACAAQGNAATALWAAAVWARAPLAMELRALEPASRDRGLFASLHHHVSVEDGWIAMALALALLAPPFGELGQTAGRVAVGMGAGLLASLGWHALLRRRLGGANGDVLGGAVELREMAMLLAMAAHLPG